jgi:hypothetical protein
MVVACMALAVSGVRAGDTYVRVEDGGGTRDRKTTWKTDYGSFEKEFSQKRRIDIKIRNNSHEEKTYIVEWYFIGEDLDGKDKWVFDWDKKEVTLKPRKKTEFTVSSKAITGTDEKYALLDRREKTGGKYDGYLVTVREGDKFIEKVSSKRASRQYMKKLLKLIKEVNEDLP